MANFVADGEWWLSVKQVAAEQSKPERSVRYELETGGMPGVKADGQWHIPPAVLGEQGDAFVSEGFLVQVVQVLPCGPVPEEPSSLQHDLPAPVYSTFQWASGMPGVVVTAATSGRVQVLALPGASGACGFIWLSRPLDS